MDINALRLIFPNRAALRVREYCTAYGIGLTLFYDLVKLNQISVKKIGGVTVVPLYDEAD